MDLSYVAAYKLGYINNGSTEVEVESIAVDGNAPVTAAIETPAIKVEPLTVAPLTPAASVATAAPAIPIETTGGSTGNVFLQLGAFKSVQGAESFLGKMSTELGDSGKILSLYVKDGLTRVHLGPYANADEARNAASKFAAKLGFKPFVSLH